MRLTEEARREGLSAAVSRVLQQQQGISPSQHRYRFKGWATKKYKGRGGESRAELRSV